MSLRREQDGGEGYGFLWEIVAAGNAGMEWLCMVSWLILYDFIKGTSLVDGMHRQKGQWLFKNFGKEHNLQS